MTSQTNKSFKDAILLAAYSFCLLTAYYQLKPLSRTLFIGEAGTSNLPYLWIGSALTLLLLIPFLQWRFKRYSRFKVLSSSTICFGFLLALFRFFVEEQSIYHAIWFYLLIDVYIVILLENFWSVNNTVFKSIEGKKWYGILASGAILGGIFGSALASFYLKFPNTKSIDLINISIGFLIISLIIAKIGFIQGSWIEPEKSKSSPLKNLDLAKQAIKIPVMRVVFIFLLLSQLVEPIVEYIFLHQVEISFESLKDRTIYISNIFTIISTTGLLINVILLPIILNKFGLVKTLLMQPILIAGVSIFNLTTSTLFASSILKTLDRSLSYSIGRSAREILYLEQNSEIIYFVKSWIDMFGYRLFKIFGALLALSVSSKLENYALSVILIVLCSLWIISILYSFKILRNRT